AILYGIGGIGKTELATQFLQSSNLLCPKKIVFDDEQEVSFENFLLKIDYSSEIISNYANIVCLNKDMANNVLLNSVKELSSDVILFIDNANGLNEKFLDEIVSKLNCKFLITTRKKLNIPQDIFNKEILELDISFTFAIFGYYYSRLKNDDKLTFEENIHKEFLGNTQAIIWVAKMLEEQNITLQEYCDKRELYLKNNNFNGDIHGCDRFDTVANNLCEFLKITDFMDNLQERELKRILPVMAIFKQFGVSEKYLIERLELNTSNEFIKLYNLGLINREKNNDNDYVLTMHPMVERALILYGLDMDLSDCKIVVDYIQKLFDCNKIKADTLDDLRELYISLENVHKNITQQPQLNQESSNDTEKKEYYIDQDISDTLEDKNNDGVVNILDILMDEENTQPIVLFDAVNKRKISFEQIAVIPYEEKTYCILKPIDKIDNVADNEAAVFYVQEDGEGNALPVLKVEMDVNIARDVFLEYNKMLFDYFRNSIG
ncbi:MAG: hypothetical protein K2M44_05855, partial [Clostridia bacterium]|nr:hypothetical protein [Clostridia bacterium]